MQILSMLEMIKKQTIQSPMIFIGIIIPYKPCDSLVFILNTKKVFIVKLSPVNSSSTLLNGLCLHYFQNKTKKQPYCYIKYIIHDSLALKN